MSEERRTKHRAHVPGIHATYETASGELRKAEVLDLSVGGLFLSTKSPTAVGKRVALEIAVDGEPAPWSALGRVVWTRPTTIDDDHPAGMAVKLIDVDDAVMASIERLVAMREPTEPGVGGATDSPRAPRERTVLGVGRPASIDATLTPVAFAPVEALMAVAARHEVETGQAPAEVPVSEAAPGPEAAPPAAPTTAPIAREASIAIDLVAKKSMPLEAVLAASRELPVDAEDPPRRSRSKGWILLVAVLALAMAAYAFREQLLSVWNGVSS